MATVTITVPGPGNLAVGSRLYPPGASIEVDESVARELGLLKPKKKPAKSRRSKADGA